METKNKLIIRALNGEKLSTPPVWMMRQAGRYLPEYKATRSLAGDFLSLCYNPELATEVTLQPIRKYGFDAAILFADILLIPQALGAKLWFVTGEGPRLSTITDKNDFDLLGDIENIDQVLSPIYETVRKLSSVLPDETTLIGFAGAPWTLLLYMLNKESPKNNFNFDKVECIETGASQNLEDGCFGLYLAKITQSKGGSYHSVDIYEDIVNKSKLIFEKYMIYSV